MATEVIPVDLEVAWSLRESCSPRDLGHDAVQLVWPSWGTRSGSASIHRWGSSEERLRGTQAHPGPSTHGSWRCCEAAWPRAGTPAILQGHLPACHQHVCKPCRQCAQRQGIWRGPWQRCQGSQSRKSRRHRDPGCEVVVQLKSNVVWLPGTSALGRQSAHSKVCAAACV